MAIFYFYSYIIFLLWILLKFYKHYSLPVETINLKLETYKELLYNFMMHTLVEVLVLNSNFKMSVMSYHR